MALPQELLISQLTPAGGGTNYYLNDTLTLNALIIILPRQYEVEEQVQLIVDPNIYDGKSIKLDAMEPKLLYAIPLGDKDWLLIRKLNENEYELYDAILINNVMVAILNARAKKEN